MSLSVYIHSPDIHAERKFDVNLTIGALKNKLEPVTGIPYTSQNLTLHPPGTQLPSNSSSIPLSDDEKTLHEYGVQEWCVIEINSSDPNARPAGEFTDTSRVDKYEISQEDYEARSDTVLAQLKSHGLGRFAAPIEKAASLFSPPSHPHVAPPNIINGARCIVLPISSAVGAIQPDSKQQLGEKRSQPEDQSGVGKDSLERRGTIRFVGKTAFGIGANGSADGGGGDWVGVEYDEPIGKNDGSVNGERYFQCRPSHGAFVRPERVQVGDYPEIDEFAEDDGPDEI